MGMGGLLPALLLTASLVGTVFPPPAAQPGQVSIQAQVGLQGYVHPFHPSTLRVGLASPFLVVGELRVSLGAQVVAVAVEVPAGGEKLYTVELPPSRASRRVMVSLWVDEDEIARLPVNLKVAGSELLVGLFGAPAAERVLGTVRSVPVGRPVTALALGSEDLEGDFSALAYLVAGPGSASGAGQEVDERIAAWVEQGGRLVGPMAEVASFLGGEELAPLEGTGAAVARVGRGEVVVFETGRPVAAEEWARVIRDVPPPLIHTNFHGPEPGFQLLEAASGGRSAPVPGLPWLLGGILAYVALTGPVNFIVLRRLGRPDWAWLTVPALSLLFVGGFWLAGRRQLDERVAAHATVVVDEGSAARARSALIMVAGDEGTHTLELPAGWTGYPLDASGWFGIGARVEARVLPGEEGTTIAFELPRLGAGTAEALWSPEMDELSARLSRTGENLELRVANGTPWRFWAWGMAHGSSASASAALLEPGREGTLSLRLDAVREPFEPPLMMAVMEKIGHEPGGVAGPDPWRRLGPLAFTLTEMAPELMSAGPFFFGYTDDLAYQVGIDGRPEAATGPSLVVVPLDLSDEEVLEMGRATPQVLALEGASRVEGAAMQIFAPGVEAVLLRYQLPAVPPGQLSISRGGPGFGFRVESAQAFDWGAGQFREVGWPATFPGEGLFSADGELVVRLAGSEQEAPEIFPTSYVLEWDT